MLTGKVALVTGATRGIGKVIAQELAAQGAVVVGTATSEAGAQTIADTLSAQGGTGIVLDVTSGAQIEQTLSEIQAKFGEVAVLVNNAGITRDNLLMRMKDDEWNAIIATNLTSVFTLSRAVLRPMMKARFGRIINISSVVAGMGSAGQTNYGAAKAGLIGFTRSLAREVGSRGITVNCVAPGFIETDMTKVLEEDRRKILLQEIATGSFGQPEDVAYAVSFLASPRAGYITGATLHVNGGMYMC